MERGLSTIDARIGAGADGWRLDKALADALPDVSFVGRLATYKYYNMDQVVGQALATYRKLSAKFQQASVA